MSLMVDFAKSQEAKNGLWFTEDAQRFFVEFEKIGMMFTIPGNETIVTFIEDVRRNLSRVRVEADLKQLTTLLPEDSYLEVLANADEWNRDGEAIHPYIVMKSAINSYLAKDQKITTLCIDDAACLSKHLNGVTQMDENTLDYLRGSYLAVSDNKNFFLPKDHPALTA